MKKDVLRIFLEVDYSPTTTEEFVFRNRNDGGRFILENTLSRPGYTKTRIASDERSNTYIDKYTRDASINPIEYYVISGRDQRMAVVKCFDSSYCKGHTTLDKKISVDYYFDGSFKNLMYIIDDSIHALLGRFPVFTLK